MWNMVERDRGEISCLLGGWDRWVYPDKEKWRPDLAAVAAAIQFVKDTGRLEEEAQERA